MAFKYLNVNPLDMKESDCVVRAISSASGYSYAEIQDKLYYISKIFDCDELCVSCYKHLLENVFKYDREYCRGMTTREFCEEHPYGIYIVRMNGHLSMIYNGDIYDIWDCSNEILTDAWRVD